MKIKTSELTGAALDWAVAKCEELVYETPADFLLDLVSGGVVNYSTDWSQGGPIIEREQITVGADGIGWCAGIPWDGDWISGFVQRGDTPLIAAMRCYVASELGDEVEIPDAIRQEIPEFGESK
jgi:hypothetical protein